MTAPRTLPLLTVLHYTGYPDDHSGVVSVVRAVAAAERFHCVLGVGPGFVQHRAHPLAALELPSIEPERISPSALWRARNVARAVQDWLAADVMRVYHGHSRAGLLVALWLRRFRERRVVATVHSFGRQRWFYRWAAGQLGGKLFWLSPAMKRYYGIAPDNWEGCVPNGVAREIRTRNPAPRHRERVVLGGAGMLVPWKAWHLVLEAFARMPESVRARIEFRHIGATDGTPDSLAYERTLRELTRRLDLEDRVRWQGWQPSIDPLLAEVDCVLVPSIREPFSMVALEAQFAGIPVVAADDGGPVDFVAAGRGGWFFRSGDAGDLARVLAGLATGDALAEVEIEPGGLRRFQAASVAARWEEIYRSLAVRGGGA